MEKTRHFIVDTPVGQLAIYAKHDKTDCAADYTAVTRAKAKVILIGQKQAVFVAIHKCDVGQRNTVLADRIVAYYNRELSRRVA